MGCPREMGERSRADLGCVEELRGAARAARLATHLSVAMLRSRRSQAACARSRPRVTRGYGPAKQRCAVTRVRRRHRDITNSISIIWPEPPSASLRSGHLSGWNRQLATQGAGADARGSVNTTARRGEASMGYLVAKCGDSERSRGYVLPKWRVGGIEVQDCCRAWVARLRNIQQTACRRRATTCERP